MIAWVDLETTGLNPDEDVILEVACIVTDDALNEVARFERVLNVRSVTVVLDVLPTWDGMPIDGIDPHCVRMHADNGLWADCAKRGEPRRRVQDDFATFLETHAVVRRLDGKSSLPQLGGSSVHFDRAFLTEHMPDALSALHYRNVDVSTLNETARRFWPELYASRPFARADIAHRAMKDIEVSIAVYRHYLAHLQVAGL